MSLFACEKCNSVENTALCGWAETYSGAGCQRIGRRHLICSACNPDIGKWHGLFPREDADEAGYVPIEGSRYIEKRAAA